MTTLPERHVETLRLVCEGHTNAEIGVLMFVGEETIKSRIKLLLRHFGARNRWHLAALAIASGTVRVSSPVDVRPDGHRWTRKPLQGGSREDHDRDRGRVVPARSEPGRIGAAHQDHEGRRVDALAAAVRLTRMATASSGDEALDAMAHPVAVAQLARLEKSG